MAKHSGGTFARLVADLHSLLEDIGANVSYIQKELPALKVSRVERKRIDESCTEFQDAIYDVGKEILNLEDKLGLHPGQEPFDPNITNPDPRVTMGFIASWLLAEIETMHQTVLRLDLAAAKAPTNGGVYLLVSESATNILRSYNKIKKILNAIHGQLDKPTA